MGVSVTVDGPLPVAPTPGFHASIAPFSEAKMNSAEPEWPAGSWTKKPARSGLNTWPVGAPEVMFTTRTWATEVGVAPANRVVLSEPLSDTHNGEPGAWSVPGVAARPHALSRSGSVNGATPGMSDTRLTWRNCACPAPAREEPAAMAASTVAVTTAPAGHSRRRRLSGPGEREYGRANVNRVIGSSVPGAPRPFWHPGHTYRRKYVPQSAPVQ